MDEDEFRQRAKMSGRDLVGNARVAGREPRAAIDVKEEPRREDRRARLTALSRMRSVRTARSSTG